MKGETVQFLQTTPEALAELINDGVRSLFSDLKKEFSTPQNDELLTNEQTCQFFQIDKVTLWRWSKKGKVNPYGIGSRRYYLKSELMASLIPLNSPKVSKLNTSNPLV
jgi:hypothetical protein